MRNKWVSLIVGVLFSGLLWGDAAPITYDGHTLTTRENTDIRMASEEVNIYWGNRIRVVASFEMQNDANRPVALFVGFPVERQDAARHRRDRVTGAFIDTEPERPVFDFRVTLAGDSKPVEIRRIEQEKPPRIWSGWNQTFPPGKTVFRVEYHVEPFKVRFGNGLYENLFYIMDTGALWKGTISQADVKVHFAEPVAAEQIREGTWPRGWWIDGNDLCWRFKNFEPTCRHNIQVDYMPAKVYRDLQQLREAVREDPQDETQAVELARLYFSLCEPPYNAGEYGPPGILSCAEYASLLSKITDSNDRAEFVRSYADTNEVPITVEAISQSFWANKYPISAVPPKPEQYQCVRQRSRTSIPWFRMVHILSSAGYPPYRSSEYVAPARELLERLLAKNPKNADAWLEYVSNCHLFVYAAYSPEMRRIYWCPIPPKQKEIVTKAHAQCPANEGIKAWHDFVTSEGANATTRERLPEQEIQRLRAALASSSGAPGPQGQSAGRSPTGGPNSAVSSRSSEPNAPSFLDRVPGGAPPLLIAEARDVLEGNISEVWPVRGGVHDKLDTHMFSVSTNREFGLFIERNGQYVRVNSGAELVVINEILQRYTFRRGDFENELAVFLFFTEIMFHHRGPGLRPGFTFDIMRYSSEWLGGTERSEDTLKGLCCDPHFVFEGNKWTITYNAFKSDGGVSRWSVVGRHDPQANINRILRIDVTPVKPPGTFKRIPGTLY